jgi:hypothetical protein
MYAEPIVIEQRVDAQHDLQQRNHVHCSSCHARCVPGIHHLEVRWQCAAIAAHAVLDTAQPAGTANQQPP